MKPSSALPLRLAMWSGPRNVSTAMLRAWGNRRDTVVVDEPFYACYLARTGRDHPGAAEVIAEGETDWPKVIAQLERDLPAGKSIFYQKQMTHHFRPEIEREWLARLTNCFLIRDPAEVIASYLKKSSDPSLEELGFAQQAEIFDWVRTRLGVPPPVIEAGDLLRNPERILRLLCAAVGVEFDPAMLSWPAGLRETDGIWAKHWYAEVARSTSFQPYQRKETRVPDRLRAVHQSCQECYRHLFAHRLH